MKALRSRVEDKHAVPCGARAVDHLEAVVQGEEKSVVLAPIPLESDLQAEEEERESRESRVPTRSK